MTIPTDDDASTSGRARRFKIGPRCRSRRSTVCSSLIRIPARYIEPMAKRDAVIRFGVGNPAGTHGQVWRLWVDKSGESAYLATHNLGAYYKTSFHRRSHLSGFTTEEGRRLRAAGRPVPRRSEWVPVTEQAPGLRRLMLVVEPASEVRYETPWPNPGRVTWVSAPPAGHAIEFQIWETPWFGGAAFETTGTKALWGARMSEDRALRLTWRQVDFDSPYLVGELAKYRRMAWAVPDVREKVAAGRDIGMFVEATWDQTGDQFYLHVAAFDAERTEGGAGSDS